MFAATASATLCAWLAVHHPLSGVAALAAASAMAVAALAAPRLWLLVLPLLLPVLALAPWSGWLLIEEMDLIVLATATGAYARLAWSGASHARPRAPRRDGLEVLLVAWMTLAVAIGVWRGLADAGSMDLGWFQSYRDPGNVLRQAKAWCWALLLWPLWRAACRAAPAESARMLSQGMVGGLALTGLVVVAERAAFPGLTNVSADYRTTALFWEMHVGGAALDGYLALGIPFAVLELLRPVGLGRRLFAAVTTVLAGYAALSTFSRIDYVALPLGAICTAWLQWRAAPGTPRASLWPRGLWSVLASGLLFSAGALWIFPSSGYRGLLALLGCALLLMAIGPLVATAAAGMRLRALGLGMSIAAAGAGLAWAWPSKGAYGVFAVCAVGTGVCIWRRGPRHWSLAGFIGTVAGMVLVAGHWGEDAGFIAALPVGAVLLLAPWWPRLAASNAWPNTATRQGWAACGMLLAALTVGTFQGGAYMAGRMSASASDMEIRESHWRTSLDLAHTLAERLFGVGLGRYPERYAFDAAPGKRPADWRWVADDAAGERGHVVLAAGQYATAAGEVLRLSQRIAAPGGPVTASLDVRAEPPVKVRLEVCEKNLLYSQNCADNVVVLGQDGGWTHAQVPLKGGLATRGSWYAPRIITFSIGVESEGSRAEFDNVQLTTRSGRQLLDNGGFDRGTAHWFFTSDRIHLPWHAKSLVVQTMFDMGLFGLAALVCLYAVALRRTARGEVSAPSIAPALAGALLGFAVVGLTDSLLEVPRLALLVYLFLLIGLSQRGGGVPARVGPSGARP